MIKENIDLAVFLEETNPHRIICGESFTRWNSSANGILGRQAMSCNNYETCARCRERRDWRRRTKIQDKVSYAFSQNDTLFLAETSDYQETKKLAYRITDRGGKFIAIPSNANGGKLFLLDRFDKMSKSSVTTEDEALASFMACRENGDWGYLSGNLTKEKVEQADDTIHYTIPDSLNEQVDPFLMLGVQTEAVLTIGTDVLTEENAASLINKKLMLVVDILKECGYPGVKYTKQKEVSISLAKLQDAWYAAQIAPVAENDLNMYPSPLVAKMNEAARVGLTELKKSNREYLQRNKKEIK